MGRPRTLTHDDFLTAALALVDAEGLDALTFRRLGTQMGVSYTAVYTYFESRQDLLEALAGRVVAEAFASVDLSDPTPRGRLLAVAVGVRAGLGRHPRVLPAFLVSTREPPGASTLVATVIAILEEAGLGGEELTFAYRALEGYVYGLTVYDFGAAPEHLAVRRRRYGAMTHPDFRSLGRSQATMRDHNEQAFRRGIEALLDGFGI